MERRIKKKYQLVVVAHPDDETLFMGGWILSNPKVNYHIICVTDGDGDGDALRRMKQFKKACTLLGASSFEQLDFPDVYEERLDVKSLEEYLRSLPLPEKVFTHGIVGEYGHPHHQDVSFAVHSSFYRRAPVMSVAYNCHPDECISLKKSVFDKKAEILSKVYGSETQRFAHLIPNYHSEGFTKLGMDEVRGIYDFLLGGKKPDAKRVKVYRNYWPHFSNWYKKTPERLF